MTSRKALHFVFKICSRKETINFFKEVLKMKVLIKIGNIIRFILMSIVFLVLVYDVDWRQHGTLALLFCSCHGIDGFLVDELQI